jgi:hypothetical protein
MKKPMLLMISAAAGLLWVMTLAPVHQAHAAQPPFVPPTVFQAAGPTADSIQGAIDEFRAALGDPNNANNPGPIAAGRREINWDGAVLGTDTTTDPVTPFDVFLNTRGAQFTTKGTGLSQAPPSGGPQGGLATLFNNPSYGTIFSTFSTLRLFTPVGSNVTEALFFIPGTNGATEAVVSGFGAVFTDVDQPGGNGPSKGANLRASTLVEFFDADNKRLFSSSVPGSPGDGSLSFLGVMFDEPIIARVRIKTGTVAPGRDDNTKRDIVMMDDFIYGEPQPLPAAAAPFASR